MRDDSERVILLRSRAAALQVARSERSTDERMCAGKPAPLLPAASGGVRSLRWLCSTARTRAGKG
ncbi:hypothetical protein ABID47_001706 [Paenibacillus favisporus]|uniref:Uncharacterized protein n=1 Tax=Paenibacillus favisporus TaxID=221028 RepID=A0ABV2F021_9BACL